MALQIVQNLASLFLNQLTFQISCNIYIFQTTSVTFSALGLKSLRFTLLLTIVQGVSPSHGNKSVFCRRPLCDGSYLHKLNSLLNVSHLNRFPPCHYLRTPNVWQATKKRCLTGSNGNKCVMQAEKCTLRHDQWSFLSRFSQF